MKELDLYKSVFTIRNDFQVLCIMQKMKITLLLLILCLSLKISSERVFHCSNPKFPWQYWRPMRREEIRKLKPTALESHFFTILTMWHYIIKKFKNAAKCKNMPIGEWHRHWHCETDTVTLCDTTVSPNVFQWGWATGNAATVATATCYLVKDNKAEFRDRRATFSTVYVLSWWLNYYHIYTQLY
jgi:hypothetical protein